MYVPSVVPTSLRQVRGGPGWERRAESVCRPVRWVEERRSRGLEVESRIRPNLPFPRRCRGSTRVQVGRGRRGAERGLSHVVYVADQSHHDSRKKEAYRASRMRWIAMVARRKIDGMRRAKLNKLLSALKVYKHKIQHDIRAAHPPSSEPSLRSTHTSFPPALPECVSLPNRSRSNK